MKMRWKVLAAFTLAAGALVVVKMGRAQNAPAPLALQSPQEAPPPALPRNGGGSWSSVRPSLPGPSQDPVEAVDAFVSRSRKEANESVFALNREAEDLRRRLARVEAALQRWQAVAQALPHGPTVTESPSSEPPMNVTQPDIKVTQPDGPGESLRGPTLEESPPPPSVSPSVILDSPLPAPNPKAPMPTLPATVVEPPVAAPPVKAPAPPGTVVPPLEPPPPVAVPKPN